MKNTNFGKNIVFDEILLKVIYVTDKNDNKMYDTHTHNQAQPRVHWSGKGTVYPTSYRKLIFTQSLGTGIIIGQTTRSEGKYHPANEDEQATLQVSKRYSFWVVATAMNKTVLVPKESPRAIW